MPVRHASGSQRLVTAIAEAYMCPSCRLRSAAGRGFSQSTRVRRDLSGRNSNIAETKHQAGNLRPKHRRIAQPSASVVGSQRHASNGSLASSTAINAPSTVPPPYRELHQKLVALQETAASYVYLSRISLAQGSLESSEPVVRVALLGLGVNGAYAARKLARALLSDALDDEQPWEEELLQSGKDGRSLLLRYGDSEDVVQHTPLVQTMHIPSPFLRRNNVELLVTTLNANGSQASEAELEEAILVPALTAPNSTGGRVGFVRYPVHKALVVAEGITGAVEYGRLPRFLDKAYLINSALSLPLHSSAGTAASAEEAATGNAVDIDLATHALKIFRADKANGGQFSNEWQISRIPALSQWIAGPKDSGSGMNFAVRKLIDSVLLNTTTSVERAETEQVSVVTKTTVPEAKREALDSDIASWSADAHRDLQLNLGAALDSRTWRRTAWWRLLWRIDDVSVCAADILRLSWLTEAEQTLAFISGKLQEAGLATADELKEAGASQKVVGEGIASEMQSWEPKRAQVMTVAELLQTPTLLSRVQQQSGVNALFDPSWPQTIHLSRQQMLHTLVPSMHRRAQALLLGTLSTTGGAAALAGWLYVASGGLMLYEAGAIAALGLVWSLRRLQRLWGKERDRFAGSLKEDGRRVLAEVESHLKKIVSEGGRAQIRAEDKQSWRVARRAVDLCREALEKIR